MKVQFNKSVVQSLPIGVHQDTKCPGLVLTVTEHSRRFGVYISVKSMPTRKSIGPVEQWSVEAARVRAGEIIRELRSDKPKAPAPTTLAALAHAYTRRLEIQGKRNTTYILDAMRLSWGSLADRKIESITRAELQEAHDDIAENRGKSAAASAIQVLRMLFNFAIDDELITRNPASRVVLYPANSRDTYLNAAELEVFREVLMDMPVDVSDYFLIILNTGLRKANAAGLRWEWVDGDTLTVPAEFSKNKSEMVIPLSQEAQGILRRRAKTALDGAVYVFPGKAEGKPVQEVWGWLLRVREACKQKGLTKVFSIHDVRRSAASLMASKGAPLPVIAKFLGHKSLHTVSTYVRADVEAVRAFV